MRKFKLTASALLVVSAIGLAGCGHQHTFSEKWSSNSTDHWHEATCEHKGEVVGDQAKHVDSNSDGICDVCDRVLSTHQHSFGTEWKTDASKHWHECACGEKGSVGDHIDTNKDGKCDTCGANVPLPPHEHSFETKWTYDAENHWHKCTGCDEVSNKGAHVDANNDGKCDICDYDKLPITPTVVSVRVSGDTSVYATKTIQLTATVEVQGTASKDVTWSSSNSSIATVSETGLVTGVEQGRVTITATSVFDNSKKGELVVTVGPAPSISYVRFVTEDQELNLGETLALEYDIASVSEADDSVTFSSSNPEVATVSEAGLVNALAEGEAIITVASVFDPTKTDTVTLNVIDMGFSKELYKAGYTFAREYPADLIKEFIGEGEYELYTLPESVLKYGVYYDVVEMEGYLPYFELVFNVETDKEAEDIYAGLEDETKFYYYYDSNYWTDEFLDVSKNYEISLTYASDGETYEFPEFQFYRVSDLYEGSSTPTTDIDFTVEQKEAMTAVIGDVIPFPVFGEDYEVIIQEEDEENDAYVAVADYSCNYDLIDAYETKLIEAGYVYNEDELAFMKPIDAFNAIYISVYFGGTGNTAYAFVGPRIYDAFPTEVAKDYIENVVGSKFDPIPFEIEDGQFRFTKVDTEDEKYGYVSGLKMDQETFYAYADKYLAAGYELISYSIYDEEEYTMDAMLFAKGKLGVYLELDPEMVIDWETWEMYYDVDNSTCIVQYFVYDSEASEEKGIYLSVGELDISTADNYIVTPQLIDLEGAELAFSSSNEEIATVDEDGVVTFLSEGDATITVSTEVETVPYSASITFHVTKAAVLGATFDYSELTSAVNTIGDYTVDCHKTGGEAAPVVFNNEELRMYAGNALVISSEGEPITSIDFYTCDCTSKVGAKFEADCGTLTETDYGYHWEGNADEVTFSCTKIDDSHKQVHFFGILVNGGGDTPSPVPGEGAESFAIAVSNLLFGSAVLDEDYFYDSDWDVYSVYLSSDEYESDELDVIVEDLVAELEYVGLYIDGEVEAYDDSAASGLVGYEAYLYDEEESVECNIYSYLYEGEVCVSIDIYDL